MASNITIDDLPALDAPADNDKIPVWDVTGGTTKSITVQDFIGVTSVLPSGVTYELLDSNADVGTTSGTLAIGNHNHTGVYEPADGTILKDANVGVNVQAYNAGNALLSDVTYVQLDSNADVGTTAGTLARGNHNHDATYVNVSGDTMTGHLSSLPSAPTAADHLTRKDYVDTAVSNVSTASVSGTAPVSVTTGPSYVVSMVAATASVNGYATAAKITELEANTAKIAGLNTEVLSIGAWDMDATSYKIVSHSINYAKIRNVSFVIIRDTDPEIWLFPNEIELVLNVSDIWLFRLDLGKYDNVNFNDGTKNRGWVTIQYVD